MKKRFWFFLIAVVFLAAVVGAGYYLTQTRRGLTYVSRKILPDVIPAGDIEIGDISGHISEGLTLSQVELRDLKKFPKGSYLRIQRLTVYLEKLNLRDARIHFENVRLFLPHSDPIVLAGSLEHGQVNCNIYSASVSVAEILSLLPQPPSLRPVGTVRNIDLYLRGPLEQVQARGTFEIAEMVFPRFTLKQVPGELAITFDRKDRRYAPTGHLRFKQGQLALAHSQVKLSDSRLLLAGSFGAPRFDLHGNAVVGKVKIELGLLGTPQSPQWKLSSSPSMPEQVLMLMLFTGKSFETVQTSVDQKRLTPDLAKDMVDYFFLGSEGGKIAEKFGIKDVTIIYEKDVTGIGMTKEINDRLDVGYQVEQKGDDPQTADIKHKLGAEWWFNPNLSLEVDKELYQLHNQELINEPVRTDDKIMLKYRGQF